MKGWMKCSQFWICSGWTSWCILCCSSWDRRGRWGRLPTGRCTAAMTGRTAGNRLWGRVDLHGTSCWLPAEEHRMNVNVLGSHQTPHTTHIILITLPWTNTCEGPPKVRMKISPAHICWRMCSIKCTECTVLWRKEVMDRRLFWYVSKQ